jgi:hypothetical protein
MTTPSASDYFYSELESSLASSTGSDRKKWANTIIDNDIPLIQLFTLLAGEEKSANRFFWLVSDIALQKPEKVFAELPLLFDYVEQNHPKYLSAFASWWHYVGVPEENDAKAIDYLFKGFLSAETPVYIKTRALWVLVKMSKKYPELKQELKLCLSDQMDKYSKEFKKRAEKILKEL